MSSGHPISKQDLVRQKQELRNRLLQLKDDPSVPEAEIKATRTAIQNIEAALLEMSKPVAAATATTAAATATAASASAAPEPMTISGMTSKIKELELRCMALTTASRVVDREAHIAQVSQKLEQLKQNLTSAKFIEKAIQDMFDETKQKIDDLEMILSGLSVQDADVISLPDELETLIPFRVFSKQRYASPFNKDTDTVIDLKEIVTTYSSNPRIKPLFDTSLGFTHINVTLDRSMSNIYFNFVLADGRRVTVSLHSQKSKDAKGALHIYTKQTSQPIGNVRTPKLDEYAIHIDKNVAERRFRIHLSQTGKNTVVEELYQTILDFIALYLTLVMNGESEFSGKKRRMSKKRQTFRKRRTFIKRRTFRKRRV